MHYIDKLGIGTVQFGVDYGISNEEGRTKKPVVDQILRYCETIGINILDTASAYGNAEEVLGELNVEKFNVVSKFMPEEREKPLKEQLDSTLQHLKKNSLYGYLAHRPLSLLVERHVWSELEYYRSIGKIVKIGFSLNSPDEILPLVDGGFVPDLIQVPYNYFDRRFEKLMKEWIALGCEIHTRSAFLQGLFFLDPEGLPNHFNPVRKELYRLQSCYGDELPGVLLNFCLQNEFIDRVIIGVNRVNQLHHNLRSINATAGEKLTEEVVPLPIEILMPTHWPK